MGLLAALCLGAGPACTGKSDRSHLSESIRLAPRRGNQAAAARARTATGARTAASASDEATILHLTDRLGEATVASAERREAGVQGRRWAGAELHGAWKPLGVKRFARLCAVELEPLANGHRLTLSGPSGPDRHRRGFLTGGMAVDLEGLVVRDWEAVRIRARSRGRFAGITVAHNIETPGALPNTLFFFEQALPVFNDGSEQTYVIPLRTGDDSAARPLRSLALIAATPTPASLDVLRVELVPRGSSFRTSFGVQPVARSGETRDTLFAHTPATIRYKVNVPDRGRLDLGLSSEPGETVRYRIAATKRGARTQLLLDETVAGARTWQQRSVDLGAFAGATIELSLEASSKRPGTVSLWGAPMVSGSTPGRRPNVIFYVIDGGGADLMSVYDDNRRTTPFLERLVAQGALFERAHSNSTWTQSSTASFMTSLHHSVLGGHLRGIHSTPIPASATTMAEHMRKAGYQTASFTTNPNAGRIIGVQQGVDVLRDEVETEYHSTSSEDLHEVFWSFRDAYPGSPYWAHIQTTDVHQPFEPQPPFAGLFASAAQRTLMERWRPKIFAAVFESPGDTSTIGAYDLALERTRIDRHAYFNTLRAFHDEAMAHQDHALRQFVQRLRARGEWHNTLLIIGSDHGHPAATFARFGRGLLSPQPEPWQGAMFNSYATRVPLIFVWPKRIRGRQRFSQPVSMIDVLPTLLELVGLPQPKVAQGQSLAPLLLGKPKDLDPVILDEFRVADSGAMVGNLEIIDGRWGASLELGSRGTASSSNLGRHEVPVGGRWGASHRHFPDVPRLLLYDLWNDPFTTRAVNEQHPDLVAYYETALLKRWDAHRALFGLFGERSDVALTRGQLEQLRSLGYVR